MSAPDAGRRDDLAARLGAVRARIGAATAAAGRAEAPGLIVVTKFFPASDVALLHGLGVRDVGENRDQEAAAKAADLAGLDLDWHFIGQLQTNKAKSVVRYASHVHSVDRPQLAAALEKAMVREDARRQDAGEDARPALRCLVQVDLGAGPAAGTGAGPGRGGAGPADVPALADAIAGASRLELAGLMAVAPLGEDPAAAFARLMDLAARTAAAHPGATMVSAGMSGDLEAAVAAGATHLRVGSDVLGPRPAVR